MSRWWINKDGLNTGEIFDDGILYVNPGDEGFTRDLIDAEVASRGEGYSADYMGVSYPPPEPEE